MQHFPGGLCVAPPGVMHMAHFWTSFCFVPSAHNNTTRTRRTRPATKSNKNTNNGKNNSATRHNTTESKAPHSKANVSIFFRLVMHHRSNDVANMLRTINHYNVIVDLRGVSVAIVKSCYGTHVLIEQFNSWNMPCLALLQEN